ncbi:MAG: energy transducer TonB [Gammaproteobacteria bacterium]|nr:energy transducer TonB [Gammaproteobacteria bacterium]
MALAISTPTLPRRALVFAAIVALHVGFVLVLNSGLAIKAVEQAFGPIKTEMIEEVVDDEEAPPPPPPKIEVAPPPFVPPPDIAIDLPVETTTTTAITATTKKPVVKPPPPAPVARVAPRQNPRRPIIYPDYPPQSKRLGEEGTTTLRMLILPDGRVGKCEVLVSSGFPRLDEAAVKQALRSWRFLPGTENGKPAAMDLDLRVKWQIKVEKG